LFEGGFRLARFALGRNDKKVVCKGPGHDEVGALVAFLDPISLAGIHASLVPLSRHHLDPLVDCVRDGELWKLWYTSIPAPEGMKAEIDRRLKLQAEGRMLPFAVLDAQGRVAGMTTYMNVDAPNRRLEIGSTWYRASVQRTPLNTECKRMLLAHAFETLDCIAVEFRTHVLNNQSRRAIERLGAKLDGILRRHMIQPNGSIRDSVVYSITAEEWPMVKSHLDWQLDKPR
jgi:RimJ/RimL family protein N-acetyltransferase